MNVHILFEDSSTGGLRWVLHESGHEQVIGFTDQFAVGPIYRLCLEAGFVKNLFNSACCT